MTATTTTPERVEVERLSDLIAQVGKVAPLPWTYEFNDVPQSRVDATHEVFSAPVPNSSHERPIGVATVGVDGWWRAGVGDNERNIGQLIAAAVNALPLLLATVQASDADIARLEKERDEAQGGDAVLRGHHAAHGETPSMTASSRAYWQARALAAEAESARLRELVRRATLNTPEYYVDWHSDARAALANASKQEVVDHG